MLGVELSETYRNRLRERIAAANMDGEGGRRRAVFVLAVQAVPAPCSRQLGLRTPGMQAWLHDDVVR